MTIYFASLRLCVKFGSQSREDAKIIKDHICEKHSTTNLFCGMVLVTDSHKNKTMKNFIKKYWILIGMIVASLSEGLVTGNIYRTTNGQLMITY